MDEKVTASYYISSVTQAEIERLAKEMDRSASWLVDSILTQYVEKSKTLKRKTGPLPERKSS